MQLLVVRCPPGRNVMERDRKQPATAGAAAALTKASRSFSVIGLAPSTAMVRTAIGSFAGSVSIKGAVGVVFDVETPPP